ncbi:hypothetical protein LI237_16500, partial [Anaerostipes caccae]|uniref:hypothetical protein n=1 Tax=Anaerostipes caccae TaxID=105841 RepID=UPI001D0642E7
DRRVDEESQQPGDHCFEKMIGGRYLNELFRVILMDYLDCDDIPRFTTRCMNELFSGEKTVRGVTSKPRTSRTVF